MSSVSVLERGRDDGLVGTQHALEISTNLASLVKRSSMYVFISIVQHLFQRSSTKSIVNI